MSLHDLSALEQAAAIRAGDVSAVDLAQHYLDRSEQSSGAFVTLTPEVALEQARKVDAGEISGPLAGVVCPVKDLFFMVGSNTRFGSVAYDFPSADDDFVVKAMREAGLVFTGKTTTPEFGLPCYTEPDPSVSPPARCVWDYQRTAGGSSGGAAVAVAAGLAPFAHGSDGGGSVRIPAAANGLVGIKPSRGRISNGPLRDPIGDLVTSGPLARTVGDAAALLDVMSRAFPGDPFHTPPPVTTFLDATRQTTPRLRIGYFTHPVITEAEVHPDAQAAVSRTVGLLEDLGHDVREIHRPFGPDAMKQFESLWYVLALLTPVMPDDEKRLMPTTRYLRGLGADVSGIAVAQAVSLARIQARATIAAWADLDVVVTPTTNGPAPLVTDIVDLADPAADFENQKAWAAYTAAFNMTGQPAISLPLHWTEGGLPVGVQFVGRMYGEELLLSLAAQIEAAAPWAHRKPVMW